MARCKVCLAAVDDRKGDRKSLAGTAACTTTVYSTLVKLLEEIRLTDANGCKVKQYYVSLVINYIHN